MKQAQAKEPPAAMRLSFQKKPTLWMPSLQTSLLRNCENIPQLFSATLLVGISCHGPRKPLLPTKGHMLQQLPRKLSVGGQAKDSVKSSQGCDTHHDCGLCVLHREPAAFSAGDPRKNQSVLSTPSTLPTLFLKLVFILLHWVSVVALRPSCSEACRNLRSQARDQTISPALESGFLTKGPPAKSLCLLFNPVLGHFLCFNYQFNLG